MSSAKVSWMGDTAARTHMHRIRELEGTKVHPDPICHNSLHEKTKVKKGQMTYPRSQDGRAPAMAIITGNGNPPL